MQFREQATLPKQTESDVSRRAGHDRGRSGGGRLRGTVFACSRLGAVIAFPAADAVASRPAPDAPTRGRMAVLLKNAGPSRCPGEACKCERGAKEDFPHLCAPKSRYQFQRRAQFRDATAAARCSRIVSFRRSKSKSLRWTDCVGSVAFRSRRPLRSACRAARNALDNDDIGRTKPGESILVESEAEQTGKHHDRGLPPPSAEYRVRRTQRAVPVKRSS